MSVSIIEPYVEADRHRTSAAGYVPLLNNQARLRFREFVKSFRQGNVYFYRDALTRQFGKNEYCLEIDLAHVNEYDEMLFNSLQVFLVNCFLYSCIDVYIYRLNRRGTCRFWSQGPKTP